MRWMLTPWSVGGLKGRVLQVSLEWTWWRQGGVDEVILSLLGVSQISSCACASNKNNKVQPRGYTLINKWFQSPLACDAWEMVGGWNGMCPIGHKKWAWIWLCLKHRKIYLQKDEFTHSVSNGLRGWPSPQPERCVWSLKFKPVLLLARIMGWEHKHQNCPNYQQNSSLLQLHSFWLNECLFFFCSLYLCPSHLFSKLLQDLFHLTNSSRWTQSNLINWIRMSSECTASAKINYALYDFNNM